MIARCVTGGLFGGLLFALWSALWTVTSGGAPWRAVATFRTTFAGLARKPLVARTTAGAVAVGITWDVMVGTAVGAFVGLVLNALLGRRRGTRLLNTVVGASLGALAAAALRSLGLSVAPAGSTGLDPVALALGVALIGAAAGWAAAS